MAPLQRRTIAPGRYVHFIADTEKKPYLLVHLQGSYYTLLDEDTGEEVDGNIERKGLALV